MWMRFFKTLFFLIIFISSACFSQELPPILNYTSTNYGAGNQNWAITQNDEKFIYAANNDGLLEYNGTNWKLYPSANNTITRSVLAVKDKVYSGSYMDFGFWEKNLQGKQEYTSLADSLKLIEDEQFWNILEYENWILFQSLNRIYIYDTLTSVVSIINSKENINKIFKVNEVIYFHVIGEGLYTVNNGKKSLISDASLFKNDLIVGVFNINGDVLCVSQQSGIYKINDTVLEIWNASLNQKIKGLNIYTSIKLRDESILLGTISNGILKFSSKGVPVFTINQYNGLADNTALSLFEDVKNNVWVGLDNGIDCINVASPVLSYVDRSGSIGTTYASTVYKGNLYLGTNQGLFYKKLQSQDTFTLIEGTNGQVWDLSVIDETLFCGHNRGTFIIENFQAELISAEMGTWIIKKIPGNSELLLQGSYSGLNVLQKKEGTWKWRNKIAGFDNSSRYIAFFDQSKILVSHEYKGVYEIELDQSFNRVLSVKKNESVSKGANSSLVYFDNGIVYANEEGVFKYKPEEEVFEKVLLLSSVFDEDTYTSGKLVVDNALNLWVFTQNYINIISKQPLNDSYKIKKIAIPQGLRQEMKGFENIFEINPNLYLFGNSNGYLILNLNNLTQESENDIFLNEITVGTSKENLIRIADTVSSFKASKNFISFKYSVPVYSKFFKVSYKYNLIHNGKTSFSHWYNNSDVSFENLEHGDYIFKVQAKINNTILDSQAEHSFTIQRPWYLSITAIIVYVVILILFFIIINSSYKRYYRKQRKDLLEKRDRQGAMKDLASQKEIIQLRNEKLRQEIDARNRELAISTMSMIKKNNVLNEFKEDLLMLDTDKNLKPLLDKIDNSINDKEDWKFFEEAFNHADKDFFKKVKSLHPELTPNDLRMCVYLRLNLSSKEISPLLNITFRSVEVKRYRLRKKMNLSHDISLTNYILEL